MIDRLTDFIMHNDVTPAVTQIEIHPFNQQQSAIDVMEEHKVQPEAWGPFAQGTMGIFQNETLVDIGKQYGKSVSQVVLRWLAQRGIVSIPKSTHKERILENINIFDFELSVDDMKAIQRLEQAKSVAPSLRDTDFIKALSSR